MKVAKRQKYTSITYPNSIGFTKRSWDKVKSALDDLEN